MNINIDEILEHCSISQTLCKKNIQKLIRSQDLTLRQASYLSDIIEKVMEIEEEELLRGEIIKRKTIYRY